MPVRIEMRRMSPRSLAARSGADLVEPRPILVLQHLAVGHVADDELDELRRDRDAGRQRIVLQDERAWRRGPRRPRRRTVGLLVGADGPGRRDHDAGGARTHHGQRKLGHRGKAGRGDADDHRQARAFDHALGDGAGFLGGQLRGFAELAQDGETVDPRALVEIDHPIDAGEIEDAFVGEGGDGDHVDAAGSLVEH